MARPTQNPIATGSMTWGQDITDELTKLFGGPLPVVRYATVTALLAVNPALADECLATTLDTHEVWFSDGTEWRVIGKGHIEGHGARSRRVVKEVLLSPLAGPTMSSVGFFPAGSMNRQLTLRVTTLITGCTSFDVGDGTDQDLWALAAALTAGTTKTPADRTHLTNAESLAAKDVVLTAVGGAANFSAGAVRLVGSYDEMTAPTS